MEYTRTICGELVVCTRHRDGRNPGDGGRVMLGARVMARFHVYEVIGHRRVCHACPGDLGVILRVEDRRWPIVQFDGQAGSVRVGDLEICVLSG